MVAALAIGKLAKKYLLFWEMNPLASACFIQPLYANLHHLCLFD